MADVWKPRSRPGARMAGRMGQGRNLMAASGAYGGRMRMPGRGRGRMTMPGRGVQRGTPGRGRMMSGRGRQGRGRMARPGRAMPGWGGTRGLARKRMIPSKLDVFNRYVGFKISNFLDRDELETLGKAFPQFTPSPLTPEQQKMRMMMKARARQLEAAKKKNAEDKIQEEKKTEDGGDIDDTTALLADLSTADTENKKEEEVTLEKLTEKYVDNGKALEDTNKENMKNGEAYDECNRYESCTENLVQSDSSGTVCKLLFDPTEGDPTIPPPDPSCPCELCVTALSKKNKPCNCGSCRAAKIKTIRTSQCERCRVLRAKLIETPDLFDVDCDCEKCKHKKEDPEKKKKMLAEREEQIRINLTDCNTLLSQLNTKRLYQRIKYYKVEDPEYDVDKAYPYNRSTEEISSIEWKALMNDYKIRHFEKLKENLKAKKEAKKLMKKKEQLKKGKIDQSSTSDENISHDSDDSSDSEPETEMRITDYYKFDDLELEEDDHYEYVGEKPSKYELLMFTPCAREVAVLASYPRSGNSLMRNLYEKITLRVTGSDMMGGLQKHDLVGEMATGANQVQFVKTHYPERMGAPAFKVSRAVLLVRNPYDAMDSYFNLMTTSTHTKSLSEEERKKHFGIFATMACKEILVWKDFHEFWLKQKIPILLVRYEDLIRDTVKVMTKVIKFVLEIGSMTFFENRIRRAIGEEEVANLGPYKARSGGIGRSIIKGHYTAQLLQHINHGMLDTMGKFGYKEFMVPNPKKWKLKPLDDWGVYIPGTGEGTMTINDSGLVRGPNRQTNWRMVQMVMEKSRREEEEKKKKKEEGVTKVDLN